MTGGSFTAAGWKVREFRLFLLHFYHNIFFPWFLLLYPLPFFNRLKIVGIPWLSLSRLCWLGTAGSELLSRWWRMRWWGWNSITWWWILGGAKGGGLGATLGGGGGRLRILSARVSAALGSGALGLALAGGLAGLLATGTAVSRPKAATP